MSLLERCSIQLEGTFDLRAARKIDEALAWLRPGGRIEVDLSGVREFRDAGLANLARTVLRSRDAVRLDVRGLRDRQHRLLRYVALEHALQH